MRYTTAVPMYVVTLPCNHEFRSATRVVTNMSDTSAFGFDADEDPEDITWLFCRTCDKNYAMEGWELEEYQAEPRDSAGRVIRESRLRKMFDEAVVRDRVASVLLRTQGHVPHQQVADDIDAVLVKRQGPDGARCKLRTVERVAADLRALSKYPDAEDKIGEVRELRPAAGALAA